MSDVERILHAVERLAVAAQRLETPEAILDAACAELAEALSLERAIALLPDGDPTTFRAVGAYGVDGASLGRSESVVARPLLARALSARHVVVSDDPRESPIPPVRGNETRGSSFAAPLVVNERCVGLIAGDSAAGEPPLDAASRAALVAASSVLATLVDAAAEVREHTAREAARNHFIAVAAHELRTPVAVIYGVTSTLLTRGNMLAQEQLVELRATLHEQAGRLKSLVEQLLDVSRLEAGGAHLRAERLRLRNHLEELVLLVAERRARDVIVEIDPLLEVDVDPEALDRILSNLLTNALKYGEPPITVAGARGEDGVVVTVEDRGAGVPAPFVDRLFDRFSRSDALAKDLPGSGLGLAIASSYAHALGGSLTYRAAEPTGARFELVLPQEMIA